ncbi:MAG TPA: cupredoxin domain-containing protein [Actinocrinis sp.]|nr:cupredoxin domain-containing protein [Actinocrinis sp.]
MSIALLAGSALLTAGCSSSSTPAAGAAPSSMSASMSSGAPNTIVIKNFMFAPMTMTVSPGATVTVTNDDTIAHTLTATGTKMFDTGSIAGGKSVTFTAPSTDGSYAYICDIHQYMQGTLIVK